MRVLSSSRWGDQSYYWGHVFVRRLTCYLLRYRWHVLLWNIMYLVQSCSSHGEFKGIWEVMLELTLQIYCHLEYPSLPCHVPVWIEGKMWVFPWAWKGPLDHWTRFIYKVSFCFLSSDSMAPRWLGKWQGRTFPVPLITLWKPILCSPISCTANLHSDTHGCCRLV